MRPLEWEEEKSAWREGGAREVHLMGFHSDEEVLGLAFSGCDDL